MPLPIITIQTFNQSNLQAAGAVFVQRVETISMGRGILGGITGTAGGRNELMEKKMNDLTQTLLAELDSKARKVYPNAIGLVSADIDFSVSGQDASMMLIGQASATVLIKRSKPLMSAQPVAPVASMGSPVASPMPSPVASMGSPLASMPSPVAPLEVKGGRRTFLTKRLIKSSRKNRK